MLSVQIFIFNVRMFEIGHPFTMAKWPYKRVDSLEGEI